MDKKTLTALFEGTDVKAEGIYEAQNICRGCAEALRSFIRPGLTREEIHDFAGDWMRSAGSDSWWIRNDPALVLFGDLTTFSAHESPDSLFTGKTVSDNDLVTVDMAPCVRGGWGDYTRSFFLKDGELVRAEETGDEELAAGMALELLLHSRMLEFVDEHTTFSQLHAFTEGILKEHGYHNCDYHGNFGHTIENDQKDRVTIIPEEHRCIAEYGKPITFEPHICRDGGRWGLKHENMYTFLDGRLVEI